MRRPNFTATLAPGLVLAVPGAVLAQTVPGAEVPTTVDNLP